MKNLTQNQKDTIKSILITGAVALTVVGMLVMWLKVVATVLLG